MSTHCMSSFSSTIRKIATPEHVKQHDNYHDGITAVIRSLGGGGAERVLTTMLNYWAENGIPVSLITTTLAEEHAYPLHSNVRCITIPPINVPCNLDNCPWNVRHLRQAIMTERNRTVISFMEKSNIPCILATSGLPVHLVISERTDPRMQTEYSEYKKSLIRKLYPLADRLIVQTQSVKEWAAEFMPKSKVQVIRNMVTVDETKTHSQFHLPDKFICCMGRMTACKGLTGFIAQLPRIFDRHRDYSLVLLGDGPDRTSLSTQVSALGLTGKVFMPGFLPAPHSVLKKARIFVLPSLFEGFPNALIESMALGVTPVSFRCPSGPSEIINHNNNGILVEEQDYEELATEIIRLLDTPKECDRLARNAYKSTHKKYNINKIMNQWGRVCNIIANKEYDKNNTAINYQQLKRSKSIAS